MVQISPAGIVPAKFPEMGCATVGAVVVVVGGSVVVVVVDVVVVVVPGGHSSAAAVSVNARNAAGTMTPAANPAAPITMFLRVGSLTG
jgi:hypothetical protein